MDIPIMWLVLLAGLIVVVIQWLRKLVTEVPPPPMVYVWTGFPNYTVGQTIDIHGTLTQNGAPLNLKDVSVTVKPPSGDDYVLVASTDASGNFVTTLLAEVPAGVWKAIAAYGGATAEVAFTRSTGIFHLLAPQVVR